MKFKATLTAIALILTCGGYTAVYAGNQAQTAKASNIKKQDIKYSFTQTAHYATLEAHKDQQNKSDWYNLILHDVQPNTLWFSVSPARHSGSMSTRKFVKFWNAKHPSSLANINPNASLVAISEKKGIKSHTLGVFVLSDPQYNEKDHSLIYKVYSLHKHFHNNYQLNDRLHHVALFIDSIGCIPMPWGRC